MFDHMFAVYERATLVREREGFDEIPEEVCFVTIFQVDVDPSFEKNVAASEIQFERPGGFFESCRSGAQTRGVSLGGGRLLGTTVNALHYAIWDLQQRHLTRLAGAEAVRKTPISVASLLRGGRFW